MHLAVLNIEIECCAFMLSIRLIVEKFSVWLSQWKVI